MKIGNRFSEQDEEQCLDLTLDPYKPEEQVFQRVCLCSYLREVQEAPEEEGTTARPLSNVGERKDD